MTVPLLCAVPAQTAAPSQQPTNTAVGRARSVPRRPRAWWTRAAEGHSARLRASPPARIRQKEELARESRRPRLRLWYESTGGGMPGGTMLDEPLLARVDGRCRARRG